MTLLDHARLDQTGLMNARQALSATEILLRRTYPSLPVEFPHHRFLALQAFIQHPSTTQLLSHTRSDPRIGLTRGDPWLPDGVPVLILDGVPVIRCTRAQPGVACTNPAPTALHSKDDRALIAAGAPVPKMIYHLADIAAAVENGTLYTPVLDTAFNPPARLVQRTHRHTRRDQALSVILHAAALALTLAVTTLAVRNFLPVRGAPFTPVDALVILGALSTFGTLLGTQMIAIRALIIHRTERRARQLGL